MQSLILNVDDYDPGRYARTKVLKQAGFQVVEASTGLEAVRMVTEHQPPLILLDVNLPDMSGFEVCRKLKADPKTRGTTILHISASSIQSEHQVQGFDCGADSYLVEPIDPRVLIATVKAFLRARAAEDALRRSNEELQSFAYRVAHDLNEPLRTITTHVQLLERDFAGAAGENRESIQFVVDGARRMRSFIDDLLQYAQVSRAVDAIQMQSCESILARAIASLETAIQNSGAQITHDPLPAVPTHGGLENVFQNLIGNAIKYRRDDVPPRIHIAATRDGAEWQFSVEDNGVGVEPEYREKIFRIFSRLHGQHVPGNGIGLAIAQKIIEAHGGSIWVESEPAKGSTFKFSLPVEQPQTNSDPRARQQHQ